MDFKKFSYLLKTILFFCIILSTVFFSKNYYDSYQLAKASGFLFFILLFFIISLFEQKQEIKITLFLVFYFLFIFYIFIRLFNIKFYLPSYFTAVLLTPFALGILLFLKPNLKKFLILVNILVFVSCIYGIYQYFLKNIRPFSFFGNPIFFAEFLVILIPYIFISYYFFTKNTLFFSFNIFIILITLILCSSRGPLISFLISFFIFFIMLLKNNFLNFNKTFIYHFIFITFFLFFTFFITPHFHNAIKNNAERIFNLFSKNSSAIKTRILTSKVALSFAKENLITGNGPGSFKYFFPKYQSDILKNDKNFNFINTSYVHNDYLQLLAEFGFLGLFLFLFFIFSLFYSYDRSIYYMDNKIFLFSSASVASLSSVLIESFFNFPLFIFPSALLFYIICGILYSNIRNFLSFYFFKINSIILNVFFIFLIIVTIFMKPFDYISNFYLNHGINLTLKYLPRDRDYLFKAIKLNPYSFNNYFFIGNAFASIRKYEDAIYYYKKCFDIYPFSSDIFYNIGVMYFSQKDYENAETYFKKAIDLYPDFADAHFKLGKVYQNTDRQEQANIEFSIANRLAPFLFQNEFSKSVLFFDEVSFEIRYNGK